MKLSARVGALERVPAVSSPQQERCPRCGTSPAERVRERLDRLLAGKAVNVGCDPCT